MNVKHKINKRNERMCNFCEPLDTNSWPEITQENEWTYIIRVSQLASLVILSQKVGFSTFKMDISTA